MRRAGGCWVGWSTSARTVGDPFEADGMQLVGVPLSGDEVTRYYEGLSNSTLWPLYHDVIAPPEFDRCWWDAYVRVNDRFAAVAAAQAAEGATVWVHDYQLQLVPGRLRLLRPDLRIGYFHHIPFPGYEIFAQLPWRRQVVTGVLGADLVGMQRRQDAANFLRACRRAAGVRTRGATVEAPDGRRVRAGAFPISIDYARLSEQAACAEVQARAREIRSELGDPRTLLLGVDRLDYTKGILHRLTAYSELLDGGRIGPPDAVLVLLAAPGREHVEQYRLLREAVEATVGRINGRHATLDHQAVQYLYRSYPRGEMAAFYVAADVMLVTSLRDGMNLVAKEYVACRTDDSGALVLSEFTGAADELAGALLVNPHDIEGMKDAVMRAVRLSPQEARRRMRSMRQQVRHHDVDRWASEFLRALGATRGPPRQRTCPPGAPATTGAGAVRPASTR
jgi:trehalose 6-phosphate synthase